MGRVKPETFHRRLQAFVPKALFRLSPGLRQALCELPQAFQRGGGSLLQRLTFTMLTFQLEKSFTGLQAGFITTILELLPGFTQQSADAPLMLQRRGCA